MGLNVQTLAVFVSPLTQAISKHLLNLRFEKNRAVMVAQGNSSDAPPCAILSRPRSWCSMRSCGGRSWRACHIIPFMTQEAMDMLPHNPQGL